MSKFWRIFGSILLCFVFAFTFCVSLSDNVVKADTTYTSIDLGTNNTNINNYEFLDVTFNSTKYSNLVNSLNGVYSSGGTYNFNTYIDFYFNNYNENLLILNEQKAQYTISVNASNFNSLFLAQGVKKYVKDELFAFNGIYCYADIYYIPVSATKSNNIVTFVYKVAIDVNSISFEDKFSRGIEYSFDLDTYKLNVVKPFNSDTKGQLYYEWFFYDLHNLASSSYTLSQLDTPVTYGFISTYTSFLSTYFDIWNGLKYVQSTIADYSFTMGVDYDVTNNYLFTNMHILTTSGLNIERDLPTMYFLDGYGSYNFIGTEFYKYYANIAYYNSGIISMLNNYKTNFDYFQFNGANVYGPQYSLNNGVSTGTVTKFCSQMGICFDGSINTNVTSFMLDNASNYSIDLYKSDVAWYDIFGHLYNFMIYLIFDMPLISNITKPIYMLISGTTTTFNWLGGVVAGLGIFGAFAMCYLLFAIIKRFL